MPECEVALNIVKEMKKVQKCKVQSKKWLEAGKLFPACVCSTQANNQHVEGKDGGMEWHLTEGNHAPVQHEFNPKYNFVILN